MSRVTPPVTKLTQAIRGISTTAARPGQIAHHSRHNSIYLPRKASELQAGFGQTQSQSNGPKQELVNRSTAYDVRSFHTTTGHRPAQTTKTGPLMQGFQTSAPKQAIRDTSTIDFFFFPQISESNSSSSDAQIRVPLLPDNYSPDRSANSVHAIAPIEFAVTRAEISVVASHPEYVLPSALSEVVGNDGLDVDLGSLTRGWATSLPSPAPIMEEMKEKASVLKELWTGVVEDIIGNKNVPKTVV